MTAHQLAKVLMEGPDIEVRVGFQYIEPSEGDKEFDFGPVERVSVVCKAWIELEARA